MKDTPIEWCDSTVNPTDFQCDGCELWQPAKGKEGKRCYAGRFAERTRGVGAFDKPIQLKPGRMAEAANWSDLRGVPRPTKPWIPPEYPRIIFIGDMADTFSRGVPFDYLVNEIIGWVTSEPGRRHIWMWLTKQAKRLLQFGEYLRSVHIPWPDNLRIGVSVTSEATAWRLDHLILINAAWRFISFEPAWEEVNFDRWLWRGDKDQEGFGGVAPSGLIDQIIIGGESGPEARPFNVERARKLIDDAEDAQVACFVKQLGSNPVEPRTLILREGKKLGELLPLGLCHKKGGDWNEWPEDLRVRQFPDFIAF